MATFSSVTAQHVLRAIAEYDTRGGEEFLDAHGFPPAPDHTLVHEGRRYDARAVLGVAHRHATGRLATPEEFASSMTTAVTILRRRGFEVTEPAGRGSTSSTRATRTAAARSPRTTRSPSSRSTATRDVPPAICPTCSMTLPATGVCDDCG